MHSVVNDTCKNPAADDPPHNVNAMDKATSNHAFCSTDTPTSVSLSWFSWFSWLNTPSAPSCPFVSIRGPNYSLPSSFRAFRVFRAFRGSSPPQWTRGRIAARARPRAPSTHCLLLSIPYEKLFVSIRVHSWFISFRPFVVHILSIPSCPFVASKDHSAIKKQTGHPRKIIKKVYISTCYSKTSFPYGTSWSP